MTFHKIYDPSFNINYGWMLLIKSEEDLRDFIKYFQHFGRKAVVKDLREKQKHHENHFSNKLAEYVWCIASLTGKDQAFQKEDVLEDLFKSQIKLIRELMEVGGCYVNQNLGIMKASGKQILDSHESDVFPSDENFKIRILRWPHGSHFYAKFGRTEIEEGGDRKWKTFESACSAAKRWYKIVYKKEYLKDFEMV